MNEGAARPVSTVMEAGVRQALWRWARPLGGALILAALLVRLGADPFILGLRALDAQTLVLAVAIAGVTTACAAWRWRVVSRALHADLPLGSAIAACYRAQFLNVTLPGGVLGDVERGVHHGRGLDDVGRGLRGVVWERAAGQLVLGVAAVVAIMLARPFADLLPSLPTRAPLVLALTALVITALVVTALVVAAVLARSGVGVRVVRVTVADARALARPGLLGRILLASLVVLAGHLLTFWLAARAVGVRMPLVDLTPLALLILLVAALPLNLAGWGPREGAAAWAFAGAGAGASQGLAVSVAYGAMAFVATLPGVLFLIRRRSGRTSREVGAHG